MEDEIQANGIKKNIDIIIGADTVLKRKKKSEEDKHKEAFIKVIQTLEELQVRSTLLNVDLKLNFYEYDEKFYEIIDRLFIMQYGEQIAELIFFYIYERLGPDGSVNNLVDQEGKAVTLDTPLDLWNLIESIKNKK